MATGTTGSGVSGADQGHELQHNALGLGALIYWRKVLVVTEPWLDRRRMSG
jgi:hypothetical protein